MTMLFRYQPVITPGPAGSDPRPLAGGDVTLIELATLDGWRYVAVPAGVTPAVPPEIETWEAVAPSGELREALKAASPHAQLAREQFVAEVRARFSLDDELYFARIATGALMGAYQFRPGEADEMGAYQQHVEAARAALHARYAQLGLGEGG